MEFSLIPEYVGAEEDDLFFEQNAASKKFDEPVNSETDRETQLTTSHDLECEREAEPEKVLRILSLDGGGVRGLIEARMLMTIEKQTGKRITDLFHIVGGTSAGGILATLLTLPSDDDPSIPKYTAEEIFDLMYWDLHEVFTPNLFSFYGIFGPKYNATPYHSHIKRFIGNQLMKDSTIPTIVFAYNTVTQKLEGLSSWCQDIQYKKTDAIAATSAAQVLFSPYTTRPLVYDETTQEYCSASFQYTFADGAMTANNPSVLILSHALNLFPTAKKVEIISLGAGHTHRPLTCDDIDQAGFLQWSKYFPSTLSASQSSSSQEILHNLFSFQNIRHGGHYLRLDPLIHKEQMKLDNTNISNLNSLVQSTDLYLLLHNDTFQTILDHLKEPKSTLQIAA